MKISKFVIIYLSRSDSGLAEAKKIIFPHEKERNPSYAKFPVQCDFKPDIDDACKDLKSECQKKYISFACPTTCEKCL